MIRGEKSAYRQRMDADPESVRDSMTRGCLDNLKTAQNQTRALALTYRTYGLRKDAELNSAWLCTFCSSRSGCL